MKKFFVIAALAVMSMAASAQTYVGGGLGLGVNYENKTTGVNFAVAPEVGHYFTDNFALGARVGLGCKYDGDNTVGQFGVGVYGRYDFLHKGKFTLGAELGVGYNTDDKNSYDALTLNLRPVARYNVWKKLDVVGRINVLNYTRNFTAKSDAVDFFVGSTAVECGVQWNF